MFIPFKNHRKLYALKKCQNIFNCKGECRMNNYLTALLNQNLGNIKEIKLYESHAIIILKDGRFIDITPNGDCELEYEIID